MRTRLNKLRAKSLKRSNVRNLQFYHGQEVKVWDHVAQVHHRGSGGFPHPGG